MVFRGMVQRQNFGIAGQILARRSHDFEKEVVRSKEQKNSEFMFRIGFIDQPDKKGCLTQVFRGL